MKKILLLGMAVLTCAGAVQTAATAAEVTLSGSLQPILVYSSVSGAKPWLTSNEYLITMDVEPIDGVKTVASLELTKVGQEDLLDELYVEGESRNLLPGLSLKVGKFSLPFTSANKYLFNDTGTDAWSIQTEAALMTYSHPIFQVAAGGYLYRDETGERVGSLRSGMVKVSTEALLEGLYLGAAYKSEARIIERIGSFAVTGQYQYAGFILDVEYAAQANGAVKPSVLTVSGTYQFTPQLLGSVRYEGYKESDVDSIIDGGLAYQLRQGLQVAGEITSTKPAAGNSVMLYTVGLMVNF